jgi:hypothetical protein
MRRYGVFVFSGAVALAAFGLAAGQPGGGFKGGGGGFGFGGAAGPINLLNNAQVKKELEMTDEQSEKLPAAVMEAVSKVLNDKQMKRFQQIELQVRGASAFKDDKVRKDLKITTEQARNIDEIFTDAAKELDELKKEAKAGGGGKGMFEKIQGINKETSEKVLGVLTADQKKSYKQMTGEPFKLEFPAFGGKKKEDK